MTDQVETVDHPLLDAGIVEVELPRPLAELPSPGWLVELLAGAAVLPPGADVATDRRAVRDLLRHSGFRPTGRNRPSSEYLARAAAEARLPSINLAVDVCNAASLRGGLPISVIDLDRCRPPLEIGIAPDDARFVFNRSGQEIEVGRLICLCDADGPCANAVKDAQRSKTDDSTQRLLFVVWGTRTLAGRTGRTSAHLREMLARATVAGGAESLS